MNPLALLMGNPLYLLIAAAVIAAAGFGSGWQINGWRLGAELATAQGEKKALTLSNDTYAAANKQCAVNVADVKAAVKGIVDSANDVNNKALAAMNRVAGQADAHQRAAEEVLKRPPVPPDEWCAALQKETSAYAGKRGKR